MARSHGGHRSWSYDFSASGVQVPIPVLPGPNAVPSRGRGLPGVGRLELGDVDLGIGRPAIARRPFAESATAPSLWMADEGIAAAATAWQQLVDQFPETGLWPLVLTPLATDFEDRPWDSGELEPTSVAAVDALDPAEVLAEGWADSLVPMGENPYVEHLRPFGAAFPGLAAPVRRERAPASVPADAVGLWSTARLGLVHCRRPADAVTLIGWRGASNRRSAEQVSAVVRSWEDRFGVVLAGLGCATLTLLVPHPSADASEALPIAAELAALCPDVLSCDGPVHGFGYVAGGTVAGLAEVLVRRSVWTLWWD